MFGHAIAVDADIVLVGANLHDDDDGRGQVGAAYVFDLDP